MTPAGSLFLRRVIVASAILLLAGALAMFLASCGEEKVAPSSPPAHPRVTATAPHADEPDAANGARHKPREQTSETQQTESTTITSSESAEAPSEPETVTPEPEVPRAELGGEVRRGPHVRKIALTFDAGASAKPTPMLLQILKKDNVRATFFLTGKWVEQNPELVREIASQGFEIGNHTYSHPDLTKLTDAEIREQLAKMESLVQRTAGISTRPYFRAPYGAIDSRVQKVAADNGYRSIRWSVDSWDAFKKGITTVEIENRVLSKADDGSIVLMHCGSWPTVDAVDDIVKSLRQRGYELVTVNELLESGGSGAN